MKKRNIEIRGKRTLIGKSITSLQALFKTGQFIENGYREVSTVIFKSESIDLLKRHV